MLGCFTGVRGALWNNAGDIVHRSRCRLLQTLTALARTAFVNVALSTGLVLASGANGFADSASDPVNILLSHLNSEQRLRILVRVNGRAAEMYMFDTGADQFNGQFYPKDTLHINSEKTVYAYGDGTSAYHSLPVSVKNQTYYGADRKTIAFEDQRTQIVAQIEDHILTGDDKPMPGETLDLDKSHPIVANGLTYYADMNARERSQMGIPPRQIRPLAHLGPETS